MRVRTTPALADGILERLQGLLCITFKRSSHTSKREQTLQNSAVAQEYSIIGVMLLLFGITFVTYAAQQPIVNFQGPGVCGISPTGDIPPCASLSTTADVFYVLGIGALGIGAILLLLRFNLARKGRNNAARSST